MADANGQPNSQGVPYQGITLGWCYDSYGNRTNEALSATPCSGSPALQSWSKYNAANNQMTYTSMTTGQANPVSSGATVTYDASGNVLNDGYNQYWYDGEGRICASQASGGASANQYVYDPEGDRIAVGSLTAVEPFGTACDLPFTLGSSGFSLTNQYLVDLGGNQVTELNTWASGAPPLTWEHSNVWVGGRLLANYDAYGPALHFLLEDPIGTKRVVANITGDWDEYCTSLPFGNDAGNPLPTPYVYDCVPQYANCVPNLNVLLNTYTDATEHRFSNKELDPMTGNDFFLARYYSPYFGRFLSPDWSAKATPVPYATFADPQSLNLYAYVRNNPLNAVDPTGHA